MNLNRKSGGAQLRDLQFSRPLLEMSFDRSVAELRFSSSTRIKTGRPDGRISGRSYLVAVPSPVFFPFRLLRKTNAPLRAAVRTSGMPSPFRSPTKICVPSPV